MKVSREQAGINRERVIDTAAALYRTHGFEGIGIADLMKAAGLTHGGFYGQFNAKSELMAAAIDRATETTATHWLETEPADDALKKLTAAYLSPAHRDAPGAGCTIAPLGAEAARQDGPVKAAMTRSIRQMVAAIARLLPGRWAAQKDEAALAYVATMVGGLILARAVDDPALSAAILKASRKALEKQAA